MKYVTVILSILVSLLLLWIVYRIRNRKLFRMIAGMNDFGGLPLIGQAHRFIGKSKKEYFKVIIDAMNDENFWSPIQIWICAKLCIGVDNLEDVQKILTSPDCYSKGSSYDRSPIGNGLITSPAHVWLEHRKLLNPVFHIKLLKGYVKGFNEISHKIISDLESNYCGRGGFNMSEMIGNHVIDVQLRTLFGCVASPDVISRLHYNILAVTQLIGETALQINCHPIFSILPQICILMFESRCIAMMKENCALIAASKTSNKTTDPGEPEYFFKRLVTLYEDGVFTKSDFEDHMNTMLLAGGDTMIITFNNVFMLLAMNPDVQDKCYEELLENLGPDFQEIDIDQLNKLDYLNRTIKECLRLIPTVPVIQRRCTTDLPILGGIIPKEIDICIPIYKILRNRQHWGDQPTHFNPDNFLEENILKRPVTSYIPYSYGNRNCIGSKYAHWLTRFVVAHLIAKFKFSTKLKFEELKFVFGITMSLETNQLIEVRKR